MGKKNITAFFEAVKSNPELQQKIGAIQAKASRMLGEDLARLAAEAETPFTTEEFLSACGPGEGELSEANLQGVAGGVVMNGNMTMDWVRFQR